MPTGFFTAVPVHAAGRYAEPDGTRCSHYFVSSYTPTLTALLDARRPGGSTAPKAGLTALLVAEPRAPNCKTLEHAVREIESVAGIFPQEIATTRFTSGTSVAAVSARLAAGASILHLACHGRHDGEDPFRNAFKLGDGDLTFAELVRLRLDAAFFAYLSACETAKGDDTQPDQAMHLAASLFFAGFRAVIATMWWVVRGLSLRVSGMLTCCRVCRPMVDDVGPIVAKRIYRRMFKKDVLDLDELPYALDSAVRWLRDKSGRPAYEWATFIHYGI
jgi:CHAT domain-containing protein